MASKTTYALSVIGAAAAGVVIGLLLAPDKGSETRERIRRTAGDWSDSLKGFFSKTDATLEDGKAALNEIKDSARHAKSSAEEKVNRIKDSMNG